MAKCPFTMLECSLCSQMKKFKPSNERTLLAATYNWSWEKSDRRNKIPTTSNVCPCDLLIVIVKTGIIGNCVLSKSKGKKVPKYTSFECKFCEIKEKRLQYNYSHFTICMFSYRRIPRQFSVSHSRWADIYWDSLFDRFHSMALARMAAVMFCWPHCPNWHLWKMDGF